jgi:D-arabinose 1-dehydrogenase-like Zn-dependent alcohol dehydrogenase
MLDFYSKHDIASDIEVIPIQKVNEAYERVLKSDVRYRFAPCINNNPISQLEQSQALIGPRTWL